MKWLEANSVYRTWSKQTLSDITVADLVTAIKSINNADPRNLLLLNYLYTLLEVVRKNSSGQDTEANSTAINSAVLSVKNTNVLNPSAARLADLIGGLIDDALNAYPLKRATGSSTLVNGALASASAITAVAAKKLYVEKGIFYAATNGGVVSGEAVNPGASIVTIEDADGNDMGVGVITAAKDLIIEMTDETAAVNKAVHLAYAAGPGNNMEESVIYWTLFYRETT